MTMSESMEALRRANPRARAEFDQLVHAVVEATRAQVGAGLPAVRPSPRRRGRLVAGAAALAAVGAAAFLTIDLRGGGTGTENAAAAVSEAATLTAASAERSGTAVVRITHNGQIWAGATIRWHDGDLAVSQDAPLRRGRAGSGLLLVGGILYGFDAADGGWVVLGSPASIDPDSGTTPAEYLAALREDVGGVTLHRIVDGVRGLTTRMLADGATVYSGTVAAGLVARESAFKGGRPIRVLPFGYAAHDEAADPTAPLGVAVTVSADGIVREIVVSWGASSSSWVYAVRYSGLGATAAPVAPAKARPLRPRLP